VQGGGGGSILEATLRGRDCVLLVAELPVLALIWYLPLQKVHGLNWSICSLFDIYCQLATYWRSDSVAVMVSSPRIHHSNSLLLDSADKNLYWPQPHPWVSIGFHSWFHRDRSHISGTLSKPWKVTHRGSHQTLWWVSLLVIYSSNCFAHNHLINYDIGCCGPFWSKVYVLVLLVGRCFSLH